MWQELHEAVTARPLTDVVLEEVEWAVARHGRATRYRPENALLPDLVRSVSDLRLMLAGRQAERVRRRLTAAVARMSGLLGLTFLKLGDDRAKSWWRTGHAAAAEAQDRATLSWLCAQEAYQQYYEGDWHGAIEMAQRARQNTAPRSASSFCAAARSGCAPPGGVAPPPVPLAQRLPAGAALVEVLTALQLPRGWIVDPGPLRPEVVLVEIADKAFAKVRRESRDGKRTQRTHLGLPFVGERYGRPPGVLPGPRARGVRE
ncbi:MULTISPECIES: hypothetical protein [unclassified Streptomyces]|uniref:hypothetical protein n=1 Tax=unclassified Streptomyces TaxID=2593676 RepID=UPI00114CD64C|nr:MULTISPECIES: hypothetical protein [unclassified Streptomyces]MYZ37905.1 hypothetical protein [Streptomyces sp. SID4917]